MAGFQMVKPSAVQVIAAEVVASRRVSRSIVRVTVGGEGIEHFSPMGFDQWFRLFLPRDEQESLRLPTATSGLWYVQYLATPKARRPWVRNYTVRDARPADREIDIDFVAHEDGGPASAFALGASAGHPVGILDQGVGYNPRVPHDWTLVVADETGLPAVAGICASLPDDARGLAIVELPHAADIQDFSVPVGVEIRWAARDEHGAAPHAIPGRLALDVLKRADLPSGEVYAYVVGESSLVTGARRHLVNERGVPKANVDFIGYWRHGRAAA